MEAHSERSHGCKANLGGLLRHRQAAEIQEVVGYGGRKGGDNMNLTIDHLCGLQFCKEDCKEGGCLDGALTVQYATESSTVDIV
ncbi:hypothetical protein BV20DRAFT_970064, partial [Pilatotrama ljubarskyi]